VRPGQTFKAMIINGTGIPCAGEGVDIE